MSLHGLINLAGGEYRYMMGGRDRQKNEWVEITASLGQIIVATGYCCSVEMKVNGEWLPIFGVENLKWHNKVVVLGGKSIIPAMDSVKADKPIQVMDNDCGARYATVEVF